MNSLTSVPSKSVSTHAERLGLPLPTGRPLLIVDDDPSSRLVIASCLTELGLSNPVEELANGDQAIARLRRCADATQSPLPVLVLLDLRMPGRSGQEVFAWMRETPRLAKIPVIVLTSEDDAESVTMLYRLGVRSYLVKPVGFAALGSVIRDLDVPWMLT